MSAVSAVSAGADPFEARRATAATGLLRAFNEVGLLSAADVHVAARLAELAGEGGEAVRLAAALAVRAPRLGHVFVDLATIRDTAVVESEEPVDVPARVAAPEPALPALPAVPAVPVLPTAPCVADFPTNLFVDRSTAVASAPGAAPKGLDWTGDPRFNRLWTLMGEPCVNVPAYVADGNLPVGVQVIARFGDDAGALAAARFVEQALARR